MKDKKIIAGIFALLLTLTSFLVFLTFKDHFLHNLYRIGFTIIFEIMIGVSLINIFYSKRKVNRKSKVIYSLINTALVSFSLVILYIVPAINQKSRIFSALPFIQQMQLMSREFTSTLFSAIAMYIAYNYFWYMKVRHLGFKKHLLFINITYLIFISGLFLINQNTFNGLFFYKWIYFSIAGIIFFTFTIITNETKSKKGKLTTIYNTLIGLFFVAEFIFIFFSRELFKSNLADAVWNTILLLTLGINFIAGSIGYALIQKIHFNKLIYPNLSAAIVTTGIIYLNFFYNDLGGYLFHFLTTSVFESLMIVGSLVIFSKKGFDFNKRLFMILMLVVLSSGAIFFQWYGPGLIKAGLFSFQILVSMVAAASFILSYVFVALTFVNHTLQNETKKKKLNRKKIAGAATISGVKPPFESYKGSGKFIFVSYSHRNMKDVFGILKKLFDKGYKIWYDEGIEPGDEWPETIGKAIDGCQKFIVFISRPAAKSRNVRNEINLAFNKKKDMAVIMLEKTSLTHGLDLQIGTVQSINKFDLNDKEFYQKLDGVLK